MVNFTVDQVRNLMGNNKNIRNMSVIAHVDHGKSTLTDSLVSKAGIIANAKAGEARFTDTRPDEQERSITIKSTAISLYYSYQAEDYLINLIDSPGHVDFSSEVTAALRVTDGALVVVDCVEGVCIQTETVLRQALAERVAPVLFLNKLDRIFLETKLEFEEAYQSFLRIIENVNVIIATYKYSAKVVAVDPVTGNVGFGSGAHAWGFTLQQFAEMYSAAEGPGGHSPAWYLKRLWGDHFFDPEANKWAKKPLTKQHKRGFNHFVLRPMRRFIDALMGGKAAAYEKMARAMKVNVPEEEQEAAGEKDRMKAYMRAWLPAGDALLRMLVEHIPSPRQAQEYRLEGLYTGPLDDRYARAIRECDADGPLVLFVSKMVPANERGKFYAFGRVFSGKVASGQRVRVMGANFDPATGADCYVKNVQRTCLMMGRYVEQIVDVPAGNVVGLVGLDDVILKSATVVAGDADDALPIRCMKFSVAPVVSVAVETKNAQELPRLIEGLKKLSKSDPLVVCARNAEGQHVISGAGELHIEICLKDLGDFMKGAAITVSAPIVNFAETVRQESDVVCVAKSPNSHNRVFITAEPLAEDLARAIDEGSLTEGMEGKRRAEVFKTHGWDLAEARKVWSFGCPPDCTANLLVDATKGVQYLTEIRDSMRGAFLKLTAGGVLCDEKLRGVVFKLIDVKLHADAIHRGAGQIMPASRRAFSAAQIASGPGLMEPVYAVDITAPESVVSNVYNVLNQRRGNVEDEQRNPGTPMMRLACFLPVAESIGFVAFLRKETGGKAFAQMSFSHWQLLGGDVYDEKSKANAVCKAVRARKGLPEDLPAFKDYYDKI